MASSILALDVGHKRVGVALARADIRLASPLVTLDNGPEIWDKIKAVMDTEDVGNLVIGLPRGLDGQETAQTGFCRQFAADAAQHFTVPITLQDEALTSVKAQEELEARGKPYEKSAIDALAATYILEDYLEAHPAI